MARVNKGIVWFVALTFAITWLCILAIYLLELPSDESWLSSRDGSGSGWSLLLGAISILASFGPAIAAIVVRKEITREGFGDAGLSPRFRAGWKYYLFALLHPVVVVPVALAVAAASGATIARPDDESVKSALISAASFPFFILIYFGEEFGWRGYLQKRFTPGRPLPAALLTGLVWGIWHYPLALLSMSEVTDAWAFLVYPVEGAVISIFYGWLCTKSGSVWPVCLAHAIGNTASSAIVTMLLPDSSQLLAWGVFTLIGYAVLALVLVLGHQVPWRAGPAGPPAQRKNESEL